MRASIDTGAGEWCRIDVEAVGPFRGPSPLSLIDGQYVDELGLTAATNLRRENGTLREFEVAYLGSTANISIDDEGRVRVLSYAVQEDEHLTLRIDDFGALIPRLNPSPTNDCGWSAFGSSGDLPRVKSRSGSARSSKAHR